MRHNSKIVKFSWSTTMSKTIFSKIMGGPPNSKLRAYVIVRKVLLYKKSLWKNMATLQDPKNHSPGY